MLGHFFAKFSEKCLEVKEKFFIFAEIIMLNKYKYYAYTDKQ